MRATAAPTRLSAVLLGLCLAACTSKTDPPSTPDAAPAKQDPAPTPPLDEPTTAIPPEPEPPSPPAAAETGELESTTAGETGETGSEGTTDGSSAAPEPEPKPAVAPKPEKKKRPAKTYGGPPKPGDPFSL